MMLRAISVLPPPSEAPWRPTKRRRGPRGRGAGVHHRRRAGHLHGDLGPAGGDLPAEQADHRAGGGRELTAAHGGGDPAGEVLLDALLDAAEAVAVAGRDRLDRAGGRIPAAARRAARPRADGLAGQRPRDERGVGAGVRRLGQRGGDDVDGQERPRGGEPAGLPGDDRRVDEPRARDAAAAELLPDQQRGPAQFRALPPGAAVEGPARVMQRARHGDRAGLAEELRGGGLQQPLVGRQVEPHPCPFSRGTPRAAPRYSPAPEPGTSFKYLHVLPMPAPSSGGPGSGRPPGSGQRPGRRR